MNGDNDKMRGLLRILFALFVLAGLSVPVQAALTPSSSRVTASILHRSSTRTPTSQGDANSQYAHAHHHAWVNIPKNVQATVPGRHPTPRGKTLTKPRATRVHTARAARTPKVVYLTFDDGPGGQYTLDVLADLKAAGDVATFFETGNMAYDGALSLGVFGQAGATSMACGSTAGDLCAYPTSGMAGTGSGTYNGTVYTNAQIPSLLLSNGMQLGAHSWDHPDFQDIATVYPYPNATGTLVTNEEIGNAVTEQMKDDASGNGGVSYFSGLFRYPHFDASRAGNAYLRAHGMKAVSADIEPNDWESPSVGGCYCANGTGAGSLDEYIEKHVFNGAIIGLHDASDVLNARPATLPTTSSVSPTDGPNGFLPALLTWLKTNGYTTGLIPSVTGPTK